MATDLKTIEAYVREFGVTEMEIDEEKQFITYGVRKDDNLFTHFIRLYDGGQFIELSAGNFVDRSEVLNSPYLQKIAVFLLEWNATYKFGATELNQKGDIWLAVELPLCDNTLTSLQLQRIFSLLYDAASTLATNLKHILKTGELPPPPDESRRQLQLQLMLAQLTNDPDEAEKALANPDYPDSFKEALRKALENSPAVLIRKMEEAINRGDIEAARKFAQQARNANIPDTI